MGMNGAVWALSPLANIKDPQSGLVEAMAR